MDYEEKIVITVTLTMGELLQAAKGVFAYMPNVEDISVQVGDWDELDIDDSLTVSYTAMGSREGTQDA